MGKGIPKGSSRIWKDKRDISITSFHFNRHSLRLYYVIVLVLHTRDIKRYKISAYLYIL